MLYMKQLGILESVFNVILVFHHKSDFEIFIEIDKVKISVLGESYQHDWIKIGDKEC